MDGRRHSSRPDRKMAAWLTSGKRPWNVMPSPYWARYRLPAWTARAVLRAVDAVWTSRPATARKAARRIGTMPRHSVAHGSRANDNLADARMLRYSGLYKSRSQMAPGVRTPGSPASCDEFPYVFCFSSLKSAHHVGPMGVSRAPWLRNIPRRLVPPTPKGIPPADPGLLRNQDLAMTNRALTRAGAKAWHWV